MKNQLKSLSDELNRAGANERAARVESIVEQSRLDDRDLESLVSLLNAALKQRVEQRNVGTSEGAYCSFCHRSQSQVKTLIVATQAAICDECARIAVETVSQPARP